jgi:hypothetical protein
METNTQFQQAIQNSRNIFNGAPRQFGIWGKLYHKIRPPGWMRESKDTRFLQLYRDQDILLQNGMVVWGQIIQANELLYDFGLADHPAAVIYSLDTAIDANPMILEDAAAILFDTKGEQTNPELQLFADKLEDEYVVDWNIPVPLSITSNIQCFYMTTMIVRKHLPKMKLAGSLFPLLICPGRTEVGMVLPGKYWDPFCKKQLW